MRTALLSLLVLSSLVGPLAAAESRIGRPIDEFKLHDWRGLEHKLSQLSGDHKLVVVAFLGCECPLAVTYAPRLEEIAKRYAEQGVAVVGINSNRQDSLTDVGNFAKRHELTYPLLKDPDNGVADLFGAERTPEVFVLDASRTVRYRGRIDDQFGVGIQREKAKSNDLTAALDQLLKGEAVTVPETQAPGCLIGRVQKVAPQGDVTYSDQIVRVLQKRCTSCHRPGEIAPFPLQSYDEVVGWADMMLEVVDAGRMPPWFADPQYGKFLNDCRMSDEEKELLHTWVDNGCPEGDRGKLPPPQEFVEGWQIPQPDMVIAMEEPYTVPAEGVVEYQYFTVDPGFTEDRWVKAAEARPGNRSVVHHIIVFLEAPRKANVPGIAGAGLDGLGGYAPGMPPTILAPGQAMLVKAGSKIRFQMHYTPNGKEQQDKSYVGLVFEKPENVRHRVDGGMAPNFSFAIPPRDGNYKVTSKYSFRRDTYLLSLQPHMHLRGKSFLFEAQYPDGTREILLDVPHYDFNWQLGYDLVEPKMLPKGTVLHCTAHFDNSEHNPANPNPDETVRWGDQTWEEMMIGWFTTMDPEVITPTPSSKRAGAGPAGQ